MLVVHPDPIELGRQPDEPVEVDLGDLVHPDVEQSFEGAHGQRGPGERVRGPGTRGRWAEATHGVDAGGRRWAPGPLGPLTESCSPLPVAGEEHHDGRNGQDDGGSGFGSVTSSTAGSARWPWPRSASRWQPGHRSIIRATPFPDAPLFSAACDLLVIRRLAAEVGGAISDGTGSGAVRARVAGCLA